MGAAVDREHRQSADEWPVVGGYAQILPARRTPSPELTAWHAAQRCSQLQGVLLGPDRDHDALLYLAIYPLRRAAGLLHWDVSSPMRSEPQRPVEAAEQEFCGSLSRWHPKLPSTRAGSVRRTDTGTARAAAPSKRPRTIPARRLISGLFMRSPAHRGEFLVVVTPMGVDQPSAPPHWARALPAVRRVRRQPSASQESQLPGSRRDFGERALHWTLTSVHRLAARQLATPGRRQGKPAAGEPSASAGTRTPSVRVDNPAPYPWTTEA